MSVSAATMCHMTTPPPPDEPVPTQPGDYVHVTEIGRRVMAGREQLRMNQQELADKAGLSRAYISRLERGLIPNPTITELGKLAEALGTTLGALTAAPSRLVALRFSTEEGDLLRQVEGLPDPVREMVLRAWRHSLEIAHGASDLARRN